MIVLASCHREVNLSPEIDFNGMAYIKIIAENEFDSVNLDITYSNKFPSQSCLTQKLTLIKKKIYETSFKITKPEMVSFEIMDTVLIAYMLPNDTLTVKIGIDTSTITSRPIYIHSEDPIYSFMQKEKNEFGNYYFESSTAITAFNSQPNTNLELDNVLSIINRAQQERLNFLENNRSSIPSWFSATYKNNIDYYSAQMKFYQYFFLKNQNLDGALVPCDIKLNNPDAILSRFYWDFISDYFLLSDTVDNKLIGPSRVIALYGKAAEKINTHLQGKVLEYFRTYLLYSLYYWCDSKEELEIVDSFRNENNFKLNVLESNYVEGKRLESLNRIERLEDSKQIKPGDKAPYFYLKDTLRSFHTLSDYRDKMVYLHFWATWCGPCLEELPLVNNLATSLSGKPVSIINICLDDNYDKWKDLIKKHNLKGINLICSGNWENDLLEKYSIDGIPHYAIVDENGLIVSNNCEHPNEASEVLINLIKE